MIVYNDNATQADSPPENLEAFECIVGKHQRMIHALCYRMTGSLEEAEDLAQETFVQAYRKLGDFRAEAEISSWLYRIAVNRCLNWRKERSRQDRTLQEWSRLDTERDMDDSQRSRLIQNALLKLPAKQRAALVLTTYDGLTHAEAARALNCSETTVSWRLFAARRKLKSLLSKFQSTGGAE